MTNPKDERLETREPEFARMSLKPALGYDALHEVASQLMKYGIEGDVPLGLRHGKYILPLGKYLRRKLRAMMGRDEATPAEILQALEEELYPVFEAAQNDRKGLSYEFAVREKLIEMDKAKILRTERYAIKKKGTL